MQADGEDKDDAETAAALEALKMTRSQVLMQFTNGHQQQQQQQSAAGEGMGACAADGDYGAGLDLLFKLAQVLTVSSRN